MKLPLRDSRGELGINMTPMIDIVFLLIIFFLVSSHMVKQDAQLKLDLPQAASGHDETNDVRSRVTVNVLPNGQVQLAGQTVGQENLARRLSHELKQTGSDLEVRIRADRTVPYSAVEPILIACTQARIWNVTFAVVRQE
jgi:biopolymer transport protein ExbD